MNEKLNFETLEGLSSIRLGKRKLTVPYIVWEPGIPIPKGSYIAVDTETERLVRGSPVKCVIGQFLYPLSHEIHIVPYYYMETYLKKLHKKNPTITWVLFNAAFDMKVCKWKTNMLKGKLESDQILDVGLRYALKELTEGDYVNFMGLSLADLSKKLLKFEMNKDDDLRLFFRRDTEVSSEQLQYACQDVLVTWSCFKKLPDAQITECLQVRGDISLETISTNGLLIDKEYFNEKKKELDKQFNKATNKLSLFGYRKGVPGNSLRVQRLAANIEERFNYRFPRTEKTKHIQLTKEATEPLIKKVPFIEVYREYKDADYILSHFFKEDLIGKDDRFHPRFNVMVSSGRTSASQPNSQNFPKKGEIRGYIYAPRGYVLGGADYDQLEMCVLAQSCIKRFGNSKLADLINGGIDTHIYMGKQIAKAEGKVWENLSEDEKDFLRTLAKIVNFGFPGGLGALTFVTYAAGFGVDITEESSKKLKEVWLETLPNMKEHLNPPVDEVWSKRLLSKYLRKKNYSKSITTVKDLEYFLTCEGLEKEEIFEEVKDLSRYMYTTLSGRVKRNNTFCTACNGFFQPDAAEGNKCTMWRLIKEDIKVINFIHDEYIWENLITNHLTEDIESVCNIMVTGMNKIIPDVNISVEGCTMVRWHKKAKPVYVDNKIMCWHKGIVQKRDLEVEGEKAIQEYADTFNMRLLYSDKECTNIFGLEKKGTNPLYFQ